MKDNPMKLKDFRVVFGENQQQFPPELISFMEGVLFGQQKLMSEKFKETELLTVSVASPIMYKMKTDFQVFHELKRKTKVRHSYTPQQLAALALSIQHCEQNNVTLPAALKSNQSRNHHSTKIGTCSQDDDCKCYDENSKQIQTFDR